MTPIKAPSDIPRVPHLAALIFKSRNIYHEGDERSRTNPGHGYPAHTETINTIEYVAFKDDEELKEWVTKMETQTLSKPLYQLIEARPLTARVTAQVEFS
jgi:hypothetical protein